MSNAPTLREILGDLADVILPHLEGKPITVATGLTAMSHAVDAEITIPGFCGKLYPFQAAGVRYAVKARRTIIGDEMGLGKTPQAIAAMLVENTFPAIIVCPPSLTLNWVRELKNFAPQLVVERLVGQTVTTPGKADVYVIGDAVVSNWATRLISLGAKALIVDESHRAKNRTAKRTKAVKSIARKVSTDGLVLLLTGTAVEKNHGELLSQLDILGVVNSLFGSVESFLFRFWPKKNRFERGNANGRELHDIIRASCFVRRLRTEVPDQISTLGKDRTPVAVEFDGPAATQYKAAEKDLRSYLKGLKSERQIDASMRAEKLVKLGVLRRLAGMAKIANTVRYVNDLVAEGDQVLVFAWHRDVAKTYAEAFGADTIIGGDSVEAVEAAKARFQAGDKRVLVLNIAAGGVGHTLTAAKHVVFGEFAWNYGAMQQAEDRADRIGQTQRVLCHWLIGANGVRTIDERLVAIINTKAAVTGTVMDGEEAVGLDDDSISDALLAGYEDDEV